jgi:hypothetical protein
VQAVLYIADVIIPNVKRQAIEDGVELTAEEKGQIRKWDRFRIPCTLCPRCFWLVGWLAG